MNAKHTLGTCWIRLRYHTEDWREQFADIIDEVAHDQTIDDSILDDLANELAADVISRLQDLGVDVKREWQQSRGNFVIVQAADSPATEALFNEALDKAFADIAPRVRQMVKDSLDPLDDDE